MKPDFGRVAKLLLAQTLNLDINEQLVREVDCLRTGNQVLKSQLKEKGKRLKFTDEQRIQLVIKAKALGKRLFEIVTIVRLETILLWHKELIAQKFDSSKVKRKVGQPKVYVEIEQLVMKFSRENKTWGYDRIAGAIKNLGYDVSDTMVCQYHA